MAKNGFLRGFAGSLNLSDAGNIFLRRFLQEQEDKRKARDEFQRQQSLKNIFDKLSAEGETKSSTQETPVNINATNAPDYGVAPELFYDKNLSLPEMTTPKLTEKKTQKTFTPYTTKDKVNLGMEATMIPGGTEALNNYISLQKLFAPRKQEYDQPLKDHPDIAWNKTKQRYEKYLTGEPIDPNILAPKPQAIYDRNSKYVLMEDPFTKRLAAARDVEGKPIINRKNYDPPEQFLGFGEWKLGKLRSLWGKEDLSEGEPANKAGYRNVNGVRYRLTKDEFITPHTTNQKGDKVPRLSNEMKGIFDNYYKEKVKTMAEQRTVGSKGESKLKEGEWTTELTDEKEKEKNAATLGKNVAKISSDYYNAIRSTAPDKFRIWMDKVYKGYGKKFPETEGELWDEFLDAYNSGQFKKKVTVKDKTGAAKTIDDPGALEFDYAREIIRNLYGKYPDTIDIQPEEDEEPTVEYRDDED